MNNSADKITCSFSMDRSTYNAYKGIVSCSGENVKGNIVKYMQEVIAYNTPNAETILAMREVDEMIASGNGKKFDSVDQLFEELNG